MLTTEHHDRGLNQVLPISANDLYHCAILLSRYPRENHCDYIMRRNVAYSLVNKIVLQFIIKYYIFKDLSHLCTGQSVQAPIWLCLAVRRY